MCPIVTAVALHHNCGMVVMSLDLGLLMGTEAPGLTPDGIGFLFFS